MGDQVRLHLEHRHRAVTGSHRGSQAGLGIEQPKKRKKGAVALLSAWFT